MPVPLPIIVVGGGLVGLRMLRGTFQKLVHSRLSRDEADKLWLPKAEFDIAGKFEDLPLREPSLGTAFTFSDLLVRMTAPGKLPVVEFTSGRRRIRRLCSLRSKGPLLSVTIVPSPSDLINLATLAVLIGALGLFSHPGPIYWAGIGLLFAEEFWARLHVSAKSVKAGLEKAVSKEG